LAPAGVTLVIVREDMLGRGPRSLPSMLDYAVAAKERSLYNTPPVIAIYVMGLTVKWLLEQGGLAAMERGNEGKAALLSGAVGARGGWYRRDGRADCRSLMNVTFRLPSEELEKRFMADAAAAGLDGLKGHRSVGGIRASIYNAFPKAGVEALV